MPTVPDDVRDTINAEFVRRLETTDPPRVGIIVETEPGRAQEVAEKARSLQGVQLGSSGVIGDSRVALEVPEETVVEVARLDGVVNVSQDQLVGVMQPDFRSQLKDFPFLTAENDPIRQGLSEALYSVFRAEDPYVGNARISEVEVPRFNFAQVPPGDPIETFASAVDELAGTNISGENIIPTNEVVSWTRDANVTDGAIREDTGVAIIDTGHTPTEPENGFRTPTLESFVPGEPFADLMCHGSWCTNMVTANRAPGVWGSTEGVAPGSQYAHFKALNTFPGFGRTSWVLGAMNRSIEWGADVVSMSLGGTQQGPLSDDPYARFIRQNCKENAGDDDGAIFVVAAGNSGPGKWTIGSPGVAEKALTVGAWSLMDSAPSVFSSRGPQGGWYKNNQERFEQDRNTFGDFEFIKPDVAAPGGGRENQAKTDQQDELLFQSSTGWYDGLKDGLKDNRSNMKGTSMATPAVAGLVKRLYDAGIITTAREVKEVVASRERAVESPNAAETALELVGDKNIAAGFGPLRESLFQP